jgi:hypothetical protein
MTTNGTWASPVSTEGIEVELTDGGLWLEIHHPGGGEAKRAFLSAPELHRLADAPPEMRSQALAAIDQHLVQHLGKAETKKLERLGDDLNVSPDPSGVWIDLRQESGPLECYFIPASTLRAVMAVPARLRFNALMLISAIGRES